MTRNTLLRELVALKGGNLKEGTDNALLRELARIQVGSAIAGSDNALLREIVRSVTGAVVEGTDNALLRRWAQHLTGQPAGQPAGFDDEQLLRLIINNTTTLHPDTLAWEAAIVANGGTISANTLGLADLFIFQQLSSLKPKIRQLLLIAGNNLNAARTAAYGPHATMVNFVAGDYSESTGLTGRTGAVIDSGLTMTGINTANYGLVMIGFDLTGSSRILCGSSASPTAALTNFSSQLVTDINGQAVKNTPQASGLFSGQSLSTTNLRLYEGDRSTVSQVGVNTNSRTSLNITNRPFYMGRNNAGSIDWTLPNTARLIACATTEGLQLSDLELLHNTIIGFNNDLSTSRRIP